MAQGFYDLEGGWVARVNQHYQREAVSGRRVDPPTLFNLGVSGDESADLLKRLRPETVARQWPGEELTVILAIGLNDARLQPG